MFNLELFRNTLLTSFHAWYSMRRSNGEWGKFHVFLTNSKTSECGRATLNTLHNWSMLKLEPDKTNWFVFPHDFCEGCRKKADQLGLP